MHDGKDEAPGAFEQVRERRQKGIDGCHILQGHAAVGGIEATCAQGEELCFVGGVDEAVVDALPMLCGSGLRSFKKDFAEVAGSDLGSLLGHSASEIAIATGYIQHLFAGLQVEETINRWINQVGMP